MAVTLKNTHDRPQQPKSRLPPENLDRIAHEENHDDRQCQRIHKRRNRETLCVEKAENAHGPNDTENRREFHQVLLAQVIPRVELKDQHVIAARRPPSVDVDADEKHENYDEKRRAVKTEGDEQCVPLLCVRFDNGLVVVSVEDRGKYHSHEKDEEAAGEETNFEGRPRRLLFP